MANLVIPDTRFEMPDLLVPGKKPIGPVCIDHSIISGRYACYLFRDYVERFESENVGSVGDCYIAGSTIQAESAIVTNKRGNRCLEIQAPSSNVYFSQAVNIPFWADAKTKWSFLWIGEFTNITGGFYPLSLGSSNGGVTLFSRTGAQDLDVQINDDTSSQSWDSDLNGGGSTWLNVGDSVGVAFAANGAYATLDVFNYTTQVRWGNAGSLNDALGSVVTQSVICPSGQTVQHELLLMNYKTWPRTLCQSLLRNPYQFLEPA